MGCDIKFVSWAVLIIAIILEVSGTVCMKLSDGFTKPGPVIAMLILYGLGLSLLAWTLKSIEISIAYAVWSGLGTALIAIIGIFWFKEPSSLMKFLSIGLIILGVIGLNLSNGH